MTIDERLDRLAERTDAIAQSVELLTSLHRDIEQQAAAAQARNDERMGQLMETMTRLGNIVQAS